MKQIVLINKDLKMSKGKVARVCLMLGVNSVKLIGFWKILKWIKNDKKAIILKADEGTINEQKFIFDIMKIKYSEHIDLGLTQVPKNSLCGITFFVDKNDTFYDDLKLY